MNILKIDYQNGLRFCIFKGHDYVPTLVLDITEMQALDLLKELSMLASDLQDTAVCVNCGDYTLMVKTALNNTLGCPRQTLTIGAWQIIPDGVKPLPAIFADTYDEDKAILTGIVDVREELKSYLLNSQLSVPLPFTYSVDTFAINAANTTVTLNMTTDEVLHFMDALKGIGNNFLKDTSTENLSAHDRLAALNYTKLITVHNCEIWGVFSDTVPNLLLLSLLYPHYSVHGLEVSISRRDLDYEDIFKRSRT